MSLRIAVLISGSGTNLQALIDRIADGTLDVSIELVISSRSDAFGLQRAAEAGIQTVALSKELFDQPETADAVLCSLLKRAEVDLVVLAGYMRKIGPYVLMSYPNHVVNIHPSLLPSFIGAHAIDEAYDYGVKVTGVTVHLANGSYDRGPIVAQRALAIEQHWTRDELEAHIHEIEHQLYPEVIQLFAENRVHVLEDNRVVIDEMSAE